MPELKSRKKRRKKVRFREVKLKLSKNQQRSLDSYCKARKTTPNKLIKKMIRRFLTYNSKDVTEGSFATPNQLGLFDEDHL